MTHNFPGRHTAVNIGEILKSALKNGRLIFKKKVAAVTTDNANNVRDAIIDCLFLTINVKYSNYTTQHMCNIHIYMNFF